MRHILTLILSFFFLFVWSQTDSTNKHGFYYPRNIQECIEQLNLTLSKKGKTKFEQLEENDLNKVISGLFIIGEWFENDSTRTARYFQSFGIQDWEDRDYLIYLAFYRYLNNQNFDFSKEAKKICIRNDSIQRARNVQYDLNIKADSIEGIYIPQDIHDCMSQLDKILPDTLKYLIKNDKSDSIIMSLHMSVGRWLRNNWGLWGGSRLQLYFRSNDIKHPDYMSGIILFSYSKYLKGNSLSITELKDEIEKEYPPPPPPESLKSIKYNEEVYYTKEYKKFLRTKKIKDFEVMIY